MHAVIFRAVINDLDSSYYDMATRMRELATRKYGCTEFLTITDGDNEIAISYWDSLAMIKSWKHDAEHLVAQELGRSRWYSSYRVQVVKVVREYGRVT
jgi:heme-degrading monooxygenase HmoA